MLAPAGALEAPDIETSSADYARRFGGAAGAYLLDVQANCVARALAGLTPGTALDIGGGHGQLVDPLRQMGWRVTVHGSSEACAHNLRELHGKRDCPFLQGDLFALPARDRSFDVALAVRLLPHVEDWPRLLAEMCRVARFAVLVDYPSRRALNAFTPLLFGVKRSIEGNTRSYRSFSGAELAAVFARHSFSVNREVKQFALPMVIHRAGGDSWLLRSAERVFRGVGLTALAGSPVILRADRSAASFAAMPATSVAAT